MAAGNQFQARRCALFFSSFLNLDLETSRLQKKKKKKQKELKEIDRDKASGVTVALKGGSLKKLTGYVEGESREKMEKGENGKQKRKRKTEEKMVFDERDIAHHPAHKTKSKPSPKQAPRIPPTRKDSSSSTSSSVSFFLRKRRAVSSFPV